MRYDPHFDFCASNRPFQAGLGHLGYPTRRKAQTGAGRGLKWGKTTRKNQNRHRDMLKMEHKVIAQCEGKARYSSKAKAATAAKKARKAGKGRITEYNCPHCQAWHTGTQTLAGEAEEWISTRDAQKPTPERRKRGKWAVGRIEKNGAKVARDSFNCPIDRLEYIKDITNDQASAARQFEELYRSQCEVAGSRDSCTIWEPRGFQSDDGPVEARKRYREVCREIGMLQERILQWVCVEHQEPKGDKQLGQLREALNECVRVFKK